jgi:subtilase family serine protease
MAIKRVFKIVSAGFICAAAAHSGAFGAVSADRVISNNVPRFVQSAKQVGLTDSTKTIDVMIWLKVRNPGALDKLAGDLYDPESSKYHQWIKPAEFARLFAPAPEDRATVERFFSSNGLSVVEVGPKNMYVRARGTIANVNKAFHVQLNDFQFKGQTFYANASEPVITGAAGPLTQAIYGLHNLKYTHPNATQSVISTRTAAGPTSTAVGGGIAAAAAPPINSVCFSGTEAQSFKNNGESYPYVALKGNGYAATAGALGGCGYTPPEIHTAYNLTQLYDEGFDGTGQTIVIIDWCGSPTIRSDANAFSAAYGLPPLTQTNFRIINSSTPPTCGGPDAEINIDVEWAHAIAPGANIDLVVPPSASFADVDTAEFFAVINNLGSVISGSYASEEVFDALAELKTENLINEIAAVQGIAANFSTGDSGDDTEDDPTYFAPGVSAPADSPYATGVGGISLALKSDKTIEWQSGWGTNVTPILGGGFVFDPPSEFGFFNYGSGGGPSEVFLKPAFQHKLKGSARLLPDISWLADPFTGGVIVISVPFQVPSQVYEIYGGTSLACPMFSALWAIANQEAGAPLGQAAQYVYAMPASTITDIRPVSSATNVTAIYKESATVTDIYRASDLAGPPENTTKFVSAIWNSPLNPGTIYILTFGTDSGLKTTAGWDNVTGVGVPDGKAFADYFKP